MRIRCVDRPAIAGRRVLRQGKRSFGADLGTILLPLSVAVKPDVTLASVADAGPAAPLTEKATASAQATSERGPILAPLKRAAPSIKTMGPVFRSPLRDFGGPRRLFTAARQGRSCRPITRRR